jgi:hypothetical protein
MLTYFRDHFYSFFGVCIVIFHQQFVFSAGRGVKLGNN